MKVLSAFNQYKGLPREVYILALQRFINSVGGFVYALLVMFLSSRLGFKEDVIGIFMLAASFAALPGSIISGHLVDHYNRKTILLVSRTLSAIIFIICGFLGNSILIPYLLILSSFISSFSGPASGAMIADLTKPENRKQSYSLLYLAMNVGLAFGFFLAGRLFENYTQWLFWGDGLTSLLSLLLVVFYIKDTRPSEKEIQEINKSDREGEREEQGNILVALFTRPFLMGFVLINAVIGFVYHQHSFVMQFHLKELFGDKGAVHFSDIMLVNTAIVIVFTPILMHYTKKYKPIVNVAVATITYIIGFGMLSFANGLELFFVAVFIWTTGEIIATVNTGTYISNHSPVNHRGRFNSIIGMIQHGGRSAAPFFMGLFLVGRSAADGWVLTAFVGVVAFALLMMLYRAEKKHKSNEEVKELVLENEVS